MIKQNSNIKRIYFEFNFKIGDIGVLHFTNALRINKSINDLILKNIIYGNFSFENLSNCLIDSEIHIINLNLSNNYITKKGIELICNSLKVNRKLKSISFDYCGIRSEGICKIFGSLNQNKNSQIYYISVEGNLFDEDSAFSLSDLLKTNKIIKNLVLKNCKINTEIGKIIFKSLKKENEIYILDISSNNIKDEALDDLAYSLRENTKLNFLHLNSNEFSDSGILKICESLKSNLNFQLKVIDIGEMNISQNISEELEELLQNRKDKIDLEEIIENQLIKIQIFK